MIFKVRSTDYHAKIGITRGLLLNMQTPGPHPRTAESEFLELDRAQDSIFVQAFQLIVTQLKLKNYCLPYSPQLQCTISFSRS